MGAKYTRYTLKGSGSFVSRLYIENIPEINSKDPPHRYCSRFFDRFLGNRSNLTDDLDRLKVTWERHLFSGHSGITNDLKRIWLGLRDVVKEASRVGGPKP